IDWFDGKE
nr:Chain C, 8-MERIC PEPTIDE (FUS/TLS) [Gallus gallus]4E0R_F Chain F, 8-MERIC PEPTIDE (FUS/TLS) [Gallus gallus]6LHG_C Chain C, IE8 peptide [Gallus gallus]6LHG_F Chain F, IE8 peptide [Gallus gallus]